MAENKENIEIDKTDKTDTDLDNTVKNQDAVKIEGSETSKAENLVEVKNNLVQGENLSEIEQFLKDIDTLDIAKNNLEKNPDNQNNNLDTNEQQNTNQSSIASSVQTNTNTGSNSSSSKSSNSSDSQLSDKLEVRIVDKNNLETDVVATLRDPVNDYRADEPKIKYEPKVKEKIQLEPEPEMTISSQSVEEGSTAIFAVSFDKVMDKPYTVTFNTSTNGSAESTDINPSIVVKDSKGNTITANTDGSYTVPAGETNLTVEVLTNNDNSYEGNETFELNGKTEFMNSNTSGTGIIKDDGSANDGDDGDSLIDNDKPSMTIGNVTVEEGSKAIFAVTLDKIAEIPYKVTFNTSNNTTSNSDYNSTFTVKDSNGNVINPNGDGSYTVPAGETNLTVEVSTTDDSIYEISETFKLNGKTEFMGSNTFGTGTIKDDGTANDGDDSDSVSDNDSPTMTIGNVSVEEGSNAVFDVTVTEATSPYTVTFNTSTNGTASSSDINSTFIVKDSNGTVIAVNGDGSYTVPAGETNLKVEVPTTTDGIYEGSETFELNGKTEFMSSNTQGIGSILDDGSATDGNDSGTGIDNDKPTLTLADAIMEEGSTLVFAGTLSNATAFNEEITLSSVLGSAESSDFNSDKTTWTVTYVDGNSATQTLSVDINGKFTLPSGITSFDVKIPTINDNVYEGSEDFTLSANATSSYITDTDTATGTITDDGSGPDGDDNGGTGGSDTDSQSKDNDKPTLTLADAIMEEGSTLVFAGSLSNATAFNEEITLSSVLGSAESSDFNSDKTTWTVTYVDGNSATQTLSVDINGKFTLPSGITSFDVKIPTINDNVYEGSEDFTLSANATSSYITDTDTATGTITDDGTVSNGSAVDGDDSDSSVDDDTTKFSISDANTYEGNTITFTVTRIGDAEANQTVDYSATIESGNTAESGDFLAGTSLLSGTLTFASGETSKTITLNAPVDADADVDTFTVTLSGNSIGSTITDAIGIGTIKESNTPPAGTDKTIALGKNTSDVLEASDFGYSDADGDAFAGIKITTLESVGSLLHFDGTSWNNITLNQEITKADIDNGYLIFKPVTGGTGTGYDSFSFEVNDGTAYDSSPNTITYNIGNTLIVSNPLPVDEGKSAIFTVSLDEARGGDTLLDLVIGGVDSTSDYNTTLYYKKIALDGQSWSWEIATSDQITIASGQTQLEVKVTTLSDAVADDAEPLTLTATINGGTNTDMANLTATGETTINDNPSLVIDTKPYITEGDFAVFEVSLSSPKSTDTTISLGGGGTATWGTDYSQNYEYSTDDGITWQSISSFTVTIPGSLTTTPSVLIRTQTTSDGVSEPDETITLIATTTDSGISTKIVDATTTVVDQLNLTVYENGDDTALTSQANTVTLSADSTYTYAILGQGVNGSVEQSGNNLIYTPNTDFSGTDTFTYVRTEIATGLSVSGVATVTVNANADTPDIEISANIAVIENVIDSNAWYIKLTGGSVGSTEDISTDTSSLDISSSFSIGKGDFVFQTFASALSGFYDINVGYTSGSLTIYAGTLSGTDIINISVISSGVIADGSIYSLDMTGYDTIIVSNSNSQVANITSMDASVTVAANNIVYDVNIYDALTDLDNQSTGTTNIEELQDVKVFVTDNINAVIDSSTLFNKGTYNSTDGSWSFTQSQLDGLQITITDTQSTNGITIEATATSKELSNNSTATNTATIDIISSNDTPTIGDQTLQVLNAQASTNGTNIDTYYSTDGGNVFSWDPSKSNIPNLYADGQKVVITYDNVTGTVTGTIDNGATTIFTTTIAMADTNGTTLNYAQGSELLGVVNMIDGDIILPGGGNNDYRIFQFTASDGDPTVVVDALVSAHNLIEDTYDEINNIGAGAGAEHTVNTNNYYIGVDSNNMNAGQQLIFDFNTISTYDSITTNKNEVSEINIKLFNFGSEKSGDELFITVITKDPNNVGAVLREDILLTQDSDYTSELEYTVQSSTGNPIVGVEFLAGNESSFKLGIESIGSINYNDTFEMDFAYDITDVDGDTDNGLTTIQIGSGTINTSLDYNLDSAIVYDSTDVTINGGAGTDTLVLDNGIDIDFSTYTSDINDIEQIDMTDTTSANILSNIALQDIIDITDSSNLMTILGDSGDTVSLDTENGNTWSTTGIVDSEGFKTYVNSGDNSVSLKIDADITTTII